MHSPWDRTDAPAAEAAQVFEYVFPSQPQTGAKIIGHIEGRTWHVPGASASPHPALIGRMQTWPSGQGAWPRLPQLVPCSPLDAVEHSPSWSTETLEECATHAVGYVRPSQPQTGRYSRVQIVVTGAHEPIASGTWHEAPRLQNSPSGQAIPAMPPQTRA